MNRNEIEKIQLEKLRELLDAVLPDNPFWQTRFRQAGIAAADIKTLSDLKALPLTTKADLVADQTQHPPYGSNLTHPPGHYSRLHQTSGTTGQPLRWLDTPQSWSWILDCWENIYELTGLTEADRLFFPFSFGPFIGFWAAFEGSCRLGRLSVPGGGMSSSMRLRIIREHNITTVCCTPTYALRLAEVAAEEGFDLANSSVNRIIVAGEPGGSIRATRQRIESSWGARVFDHWGMTEIASLAVETVESPSSLSILEAHCHVEIIDPETRRPVAPGELGELVITNLGRIGSPLIRYRTGDLVKLATEPCPSGRELLRLEGGILGRADDMVTIRGNNVFPSSIEAVLREYDDVVEYRIEVTTVRSMNHLKIEVEPKAEANRQQVLQQVQAAIQDRLNFHAEIVLVEPGALPRFELKGRRFFRKDSIG